MFQSLRVDEEDVGDVLERKKPELDIAMHVQYDPGQTVVAIHSPYWMMNKTGRLLQYKADDIHRKHPLDYDMPLLFSFKPRNFLRNNKVGRKKILLFSIVFSKIVITCNVTFNASSRSIATHIGVIS